ncbi:MAG: T9SS type A sorting domain-containing protein [Candidatus Kapabacteria bacterium]|nr:T9SS type A sorting domain-containing protein [Candidatus Kapabacteria bacterium]
MKNIYKIRHVTVIVAIFLFFTIQGNSQQFIYDSKGTDFWLAYMPNYHIASSPSDFIYIFITCDKPTKGTIELFRDNGTSIKTNFTISDPKKMYVFVDNFINYEIIGFNDPLNSRYYMTTNNECQTEKVVKKSVHITADDEVMVYSQSQARTTSDAFLVLPTDVLSTDYYVLSYNSDGHGTQNSSSTPSQFVIVATEDNTNVTIYPSCSTFRYGLSLKNINMNKGDVYLVQALIDNIDNNRDLTGSRVTSSSPVAVFSGHQRATIPVFNNGSQPSRDCLIEQLPPTITWGKNAFLTPFAQSKNEVKSYTDLYRIIACIDNTKIYIDSVLVQTLNAGKFIEGKLDAPHSVYSNKAILVGQYKKTADFGGGASKFGDPFFSISPPREQFMNFYRIINTQTQENGGNIYQEQYIQIVIHQDHTSSLMFDGSGVAAKYLPIPKSPYVYVNITSKDGVHEITADTSFGICVYGFGNANSYGYIGGMSFTPINFPKPEIAKIINCDSVSGTIIDSSRFLGRVFNISIPDTFKTNINVQIDKFNANSEYVQFHAQLIDKLKDGKFVIFNSLTVKLSTADTISIPGFTVNSTIGIQQNALPFIDTTIIPHRTICLPIILYNYGNFNQTISSLHLKGNNPEISLSKSPPLTIAPGQSDTLLVCYYSQNAGTIDDSIVIGNQCLERDIYTLKFSSKPDTTPPSISSVEKNCPAEINLTMQESSKGDLGIMKIDSLFRRNFDMKETYFYPKQILLNLKVIDPYQDAYFYLSIEDSAGNRSIYKKSIPGFTLAAPESAPEDYTRDFGKVAIGSFVLDTISLSNYGDFNLKFDDIYLKKNTIFSIPPAQFPFIVESGKTNNLIIGAQSLIAQNDVYRDTLIIGFNCLTKEIPLKLQSEPMQVQHYGQCDLPVVFYISEFPNGMIFQDQSISPAIVALNFIIYSKEATNTDFIIYDLLGNKILSDEFNIDAGTNQRSINISSIPSGIYTYQFKSNGNIFSKNFIKQK